MLTLTSTERRKARAYRRMVRRARQRAQRASGRLTAPKTRGRLIDRTHKQAVAQLFCVATYVRCGVEAYGVHVAHLRFSAAAVGTRNPGLQRKPDDCWVLPLSPIEHRKQHAMGEADYWAELGIEPHLLARELFQASPCTNAMKELLRARGEGHVSLL